jgi:cell wall-associated NlpC family hydrolase
MRNLKPYILGCLFIPAAAVAAPAFTSEIPGFSPDYQAAAFESTEFANPVAALIAAEPMSANSPEPQKLVDTLLVRARSQLNSMYHFGGTTPKQGFDCSGFVGWIYRDVLQAELPRVADAIYKIDAPRVPATKLSPGDLMFYRISGGRVSHVTMYVGGRNFIHATRAGQRLRIESMDMPYWRQRFAGAKRILGTPLLKAQYQANN